MIDALEAAGEDAPAVGLELAAALVEDVRRLPGIAGIHVMAMGHDEATQGARDTRRAVPPPDQPDQMSVVVTPMMWQSFDARTQLSVSVSSRDCTHVFQKSACIV